MTTAGGGHPGRLKDVLLQKFLERNAGEPLHKQSQQVIAGIGVTQSFPRCEVWFRFGFKEKTEDFVVARDPFFFLPDFYKPVRIVKIVGNSAGVVQKMPDSSYAASSGKYFVILSSGLRRLCRISSMTAVAVNCLLIEAN